MQSDPSLEASNARGAGPGSLSARLFPFVLYIAGTFLIAALLAYPLWTLVTVLGVEEMPFSKFTFRLLEAVAIVGLWPLMAYLGLNRAADFGFGYGAASRAWRPSPLGGLAAGFIAGVVLLATVIFVLLLLEVRTMRGDTSPATGALTILLLKAILVGLIIGLIEELWFRGALQRALERQAGLTFAVAATALLYALTHFIRPDLEIPSDSLAFGSGFAVVAGSFGRFSNPAILDSLAALVAVGVFLSLVRWRTGRIWECIGLHAGFVAAIRIGGELTTLSPASTHRYLAGSFDGFVGVVACAVFTLFSLAYWRFGGHRRSRPASVPD